MKKKAGYVTLLSVLLIGAVGTTIATSLILLGLGQSKTSFTFQQQAQARALLNACVEQALQEIRDTDVIKGEFASEIGEGECLYDIQGTGERKELQITFTFGSITKRALVVTNATVPEIEIELWREVGDF